MGTDEALAKGVLGKWPTFLETTKEAMPTLAHGLIVKLIRGATSVESTSVRGQTVLVTNTLIDKAEVRHVRVGPGAC